MHKDKCVFLTDKMFDEKYFSNVCFIYLSY